MNNNIKVALAFIAGGTLLFLNHRRKKNNQNENLYTAPDGNTYAHNQTYRTVEGKMYENGKQVILNTLDFEKEFHSTPNFHHEDNVNFNKNYEANTKGVNYHQKGTRHR